MIPAIADVGNLPIKLDCCQSSACVVRGARNGKCDWGKVVVVAVVVVVVVVVVARIMDSCGEIIIIKSSFANLQNFETFFIPKIVQF